MHLSNRLRELIAHFIAKHSFCSRFMCFHQIQWVSIFFCLSCSLTILNTFEKSSLQTPLFSQNVVFCPVFFLMKFYHKIGLWSHLATSSYNTVLIVKKLFFHGFQKWNHIFFQEKGSQIQVSMYEMNKTNISWTVDLKLWFSISISWTEPTSTLLFQQ